MCVQTCLVRVGRAVAEPAAHAGWAVAEPAAHVGQAVAEPAALGTQSANHPPNHSNFEQIDLNVRVAIFCSNGYSSEASASRLFFFFALQMTSRTVYLSFFLSLSFSLSWFSLFLSLSDFLTVSLFLSLSDSVFLSSLCSLLL